MPLRDHFHPPLSDRKDWNGVHQAWAVTMVQRLNGVLLTSEYESLPDVHLGTASRSTWRHTRRRKTPRRSA